MDLDYLLAVTPDQLADDILLRRRQFEELIPSYLAGCRQQITHLEPITNDMRVERDKLTEKVAELKTERNNCQEEVKVLRKEVTELRDRLETEGRLSSPDPRWAKEKLEKDLSELEYQLEVGTTDLKGEREILRKMKEATLSHEGWVAERARSNPEFIELREKQVALRTLIQQAERAHEGLMSLAEESEDKHGRFVEANNQLNRAIAGRDIMEKLERENPTAIEYWVKRREEGYGPLPIHPEDLFGDANRVASGGLSTFAISRNEKKKRESIQKAAEAKEAKAKEKKDASKAEPISSETTGGEEE